MSISRCVARCVVVVMMVVASTDAAATDAPQFFPDVRSLFRDWSNAKTPARYP